MESQKGKEKPLSPADSGWVAVGRVAFRPPKWRLGRPQAPSGAQLGGPKRLQASTWPSKASLRGQLEDPKRDFHSFSTLRTLIFAIPYSVFDGFSIFQQIASKPLSKLQNLPQTTIR